MPRSTSSLSFFFVGIRESALFSLNNVDVESGRLQANERVQAMGLQGRYARPRVARPEPISTANGEALHQSIQAYQLELRQEQRLLERVPLGPLELASIRRMAIFHLSVAWLVVHMVKAI